LSISPRGSLESSADWVGDMSEWHLSNYSLALSRPTVRNAWSINQKTNSRGTHWRPTKESSFSVSQRS